MSVLRSKKKNKIVKPATQYKTQVLEDLREAVECMKLVKEGKLKPRPAKDALNEL